MSPPARPTCRCTSDIRTYVKRPALAVVRAICASGRVVRCEHEWTRNAHYVDDAGNEGGGVENKRGQPNVTAIPKMPSVRDDILTVKMDVLSSCLHIIWHFCFDGDFLCDVARLLHKNNIPKKKNLLNTNKCFFAWSINKYRFSM